MEIYLMQHGPNLSKDIDPEESLSPEGEAQLEKAARALAKMGLRFDLIISSPKKRARQTAAIAAAVMGYPLERIVESEKLKAMTPALESIEFLRQFQAIKAVLVTGHMPSLGEIASFLLTDGSKAVIQFERGGLGRIDVEGLPTRQGRLRWYLTPEQLGIIGG